MNPTSKTKRKPALAYLRVSTKDQSDNGVGLDLQLTTIEAFAREASLEIVGTFKDVGSGRSEHLQGRKDAIVRSRELGCPIIVDSLSRLTRSVEVLEQLVIDGHLDVISAKPREGTGRARIIAEGKRAQAEVERIRRTTREGLARARARGAVFGNRKNLDEAQKKGAAANRDAARLRAQELAPRIREIMEAGITSGRAIAEELNRQGLQAPSGGPWSEATIRRMMGRIKEVRIAEGEDFYARHPNYGML